ncbi:ABC transporter ATP-binding protein [Caldibacillus thermoamylovorans]|uniref:ABC transporter ATP-binding protein n=1 Tax=Caldibacillus thermoamylovorans TaxID=35841 RepID=UPI001D08BBA9|nr:ABC transporter ATP-binding protein [Caldibacillus thermoamylovorans]MCB5935542.1 ABC transporter ATP-binding protein [Bacillus sp. DFI.2.34]MCB7078440.1 ABC transporter ATP-binding protein [Caldibacillus thermoamylovorans]
MNLIEIKEVRKQYGNKEILKSVDLNIQSSEICLITGSSGAGKTTLLNILSFLESADSGTYLWEGVNVDNILTKEKRNIRREKMSFIFQDFNVFEELTVKENLEVFLRYVTSIEKNKWDNLIIEGVNRFNMQDRINTRAKLLSGGERQRLAILRSFIKETKVVFADEPTANIDEKNKNLIVESFKMLKQEGRAIVIVSHDHSYNEFADKIYKLNEGKIIRES